VHATDRLRNAVDDFRSWADAAYPGQRFVEWELDYEDWNGLYETAHVVLATPVESWDDETRQLLIYVIARDNENEILSEQLTDAQLDCLASSSLRSSEGAAKWQFAKQLGQRERTPERESLLLRFADDADEHVRRRSLMVLADLGSLQTESLAFRAWDTGHEYQRMAALHALYLIGSPALLKYLELAEQDGRQHLCGIARHIKHGTGEYTRHDG
jgi:hypothetical protein